MNKENKDQAKYKGAWLNALLGLIPGAGQVRNKQWYKAVLLWVVLVLIVVVEVSTSTYSSFDKEKDIYIPMNRIQVSVKYNNPSNNEIPIKGTSSWKEYWNVDTTDILEELNNFATVKKMENYFNVNELIATVAEKEGMTVDEADTYVHASNVNTAGVPSSHKEHYIEYSKAKGNSTCVKADGSIDELCGIGTTAYTTSVDSVLRLYSYEFRKFDEDARTDYEVDYYAKVQEKLDTLIEKIDAYNEAIDAQRVVHEEYNSNLPAGGQQYIYQRRIEYTIKYENAKFYYFRDYGGFFTRGVWGLSTLGKLKDGDEYRGVKVDGEIKREKVYPFEQIEPDWTRFDTSQYLMALGLFSFVILVITVVLYVWTIVDAYKVQKKYIDGEPHLTIKEYFAKTFDSMFAYIILIPAIILIACFTMIPMLFSLLVAFTNYSYSSGTITAGTIFRWDGFNAFLTIVKDKEVLGFFLDVLIWTIIWAFCTSFTVYAMGFVNALIVESKAVSGIKIYLKNGKYISFFGKKFWRTIMILPWAIPGMITLMATRNMFQFDGAVNQLLQNAGLSQTVANFLHNIGLTEGNSPVIQWLGTGTGENASLAKVVLIVVNLWLGSPYHMMLIIGVLATISPELYEAADIDGATSFQKFRYITLPQVLISTLPSIIMTFSHNFNNFGAIYFLTGGGPVRAEYIGDAGVPGQTDILISWIYKLTFEPNKQYYNRGAIYSIVIFLGIGIVSVWNMSRTKLMQEEE